jgi:hypothetical protein
MYFEAVHCYALAAHPILLGFAPTVYHAFGLEQRIEYCLSTFYAFLFPGSAGSPQKQNSTPCFLFAGVAPTAL